MRRVLHVIETMAPREGGPPRVVAGLAVAQVALGIDAHILCGDGIQLPDYAKYWEFHAPGFPVGNVHTTGPASHNPVARATALRNWLHANLPSYDIVHIHQLWRLVPSMAGTACRRLRVPYLIAPHTSLSPWALAQKRVKKMLARRLVWERIFENAAAFHALNDLEAAEIRACLGRRAPPVHVVPNGVSAAEFSDTSGAGAAPAIAGQFTSPGGNTPFILFLARLHTMKGPDLLLEAFASLAHERPELQLVFAGPDFGMLDSLQRRVSQLELTGRVHFLGLVSGPDRLWLLRTAVCLCQPSRDEGFSLSILEALASRSPVVISERCKFPDVAPSRAGIIVPLSIPELAAALRTYAGDPARRVSDGLSARLLIERRYTWDIVSKQADDMYARILNREPDARSRELR